MLKAPCSSQLKVWQKGVPFKTSFFFDRNCTIFPDYILQFAQERKESIRIEMSQTAIQSKAWGGCLSHPVRGGKCCIFPSWHLHIFQAGQSSIGHELTDHNLVCDTVGWRYTWKTFQPHRVLADSLCRLQTLWGLETELGKLTQELKEVPKKPGKTFLVPFT